jgi:type I restriction enzyme S subunit
VTYDVAIEGFEGRIPAHWKMLPFRRLAVLVDSANTSSSAPLLSLASTGIVAPREEFDGLGRQMPAESTIERYWLAEPGNLVVNPMWLVGGGIGVSEVFGAVSPDYRVYRLGPDLHPRYVHHLFRSRLYRDQYKLYTRAETTFDRRVSKVDFHAMPVLVPPLDEQRRIADFLDTETARIDALLEARGSQLELFTQRRFALARDFLQKGINGAPLKETSIDWLPRCPASWELKKLGYVTRCLDGARIPLSAEERASRKGAFPYYGASTIVDFVDDYLFDEELVLLGEDGAQLGNPYYEISSVVNGKIWVNNHAHVLRPLGIIAPLLSAILNVFDRELCMSGSTREKITQEAMNSLIIPIPPISEQQEISETLAERRAAQDRVERAIKEQINVLAERRRALITAAVTGGITV